MDDQSFEGLIIGILRAAIPIAGLAVFAFVAVRSNGTAPAYDFSYTQGVTATALASAIVALIAILIMRRRSMTSL